MNGGEEVASPVSPDPRVTVIVVNWNGRDIIGRFIETTLASDYPNLDVLVVDNASTDGSDGMVEGCPGVGLIRLEENRGWGSAINAGLASERAAGADYYVFMNNDVFLEPGAVGELVRQGEGNPEFGVLSPAILDGEGNWMTPGGFFTRLGWWRGLEPVADPAKPEAPERLDVVLGVAMMVRAGVVEAIGGFDPEFFLYREDVDYCKRAKEAGFEVGLVQATTAVHVEGAATTKRDEEKPSDFNWREVYAESFVKYVFKHLGDRELARWLVTRRGISSWGIVLRNCRKLVAIRRRGSESIDPAG